VNTGPALASKRSMLVGDERLFPNHTNTYSTTSPNTIYPHYKHTIVISKDGMIRVVASFSCGCARLDLSFMDMSHGQATIWYVEAALFALWGERGAAAAAALLAPDVARARC
jgi:hypothetical protein